MFRQLFSNIPDVTKNLLIINVLFFIATVVLEGQGVFLVQELGMHTPNSNLFEPYQIITHFFMHGGFTHILFNMFGLVIFGSQLEREWGKKRFFVFYFVTALGAVGLHVLVQGIEVYQLTGEWFPNLYFGETHINFPGLSKESFNDNYYQWVKTANIYRTPVVGASGAIYGLLMAFALLHPNTEFRLLFPPITLKAKWLVAILAGFAIYQGYQDSSGDSIAHFAHIGGMLFGFIMIQIWKRDKSNFY